MQYWAGIYIHIVQRMYCIVLQYFALFLVYCIIVLVEIIQKVYLTKKFNYKQYLKIIANVY